MVFSSSLTRTLDVAWSRDRAYALVADVPRSASHFPTLQGIDDLGQGVFRWRLGAIKVPGFSFDAGYTAQYLFDEAAGTVTWASVPGAGNVQEEGSWHVTTAGSRTHLVFHSTLTVQLSVPRLVEKVVLRAAPSVTKKLMLGYLDRISKTMNGRIA